MLAKRIIPCLDVKDGKTVKGVCFGNLRDAGDPVELGRRYSEEGADELVFLDITASSQRRKTLAGRHGEPCGARGEYSFHCGRWNRQRG